MRRMGRNLMTVAEMASMGGRARARKYTREQLRDFAKNAGRPPILDKKAIRRLRKWGAAAVPASEIARRLNVSTRTVSRYLNPSG